ncbi:hrp65 protein-like [Coccinella septempunctata]|uniref:hrp65 protein-like n=1 Tax=Coccinella septempunctata TaxID=41139 RepID=UPI001D066D72|nr:hrp65 protein-like [Coccinella septempunctata]
MEAKEECVESTTAPDDGTPIVKEQSFSESPDKGVDNSFRKGQRSSGRNENRNSAGNRRSFGGANESFEQGNKRGNRDFDRDPGHSGGRGRDFGNRQEAGGWSSSDYYREKLYEISGPTHELPPLDMTEKKFNGRNKLYVGNLPTDITEEDFKNMFTPYGEICDVFLNAEKRFGFVVFDYHRNAEKAKQELDGKYLNNDRQIKIRFSSRGATIKVSNLAPTVTNELLHHAFSVFGEIERAIVHKDERGHSTGVGEIDFTRKKSAACAVKECTEGCFFLTGSLRPCIAEFYEPNLDTDGYNEKCIPWRNNEFLKDREVGPWLAKPNSFEYQFATDWKQLRLLFHKKEEALKKELLIEEEKMMARMDFVKFEYETEMLKKQLEERELYRQQHKLNLEKKEKIADELLSRNVLEIRKTEEQIMAKFARHEEDMILRQKEGNLFNQEERAPVNFYEAPNNSRWGEERESYWQQEGAPAAADDAGSQGSRGRNTFLEEPGQVWKRLDKDNVAGEELFQRRENDMSAEEYQQGWKRTWPENYRYSKRNRY